MLDAAKLVGLLADEDRRRVVAALVLGAVTLDDVVHDAGLERRATIAALERLAGAGLIERGPEGAFVLLEAAFGIAAREAAPTPTSEHPDEPSERRAVLDRSFRDGRLVHMPSKRTKRLIVLDHVAQQFEPGQRYTERQTNALLATIDADTSTLRRYLVDEGFLDRADGEYWRSGGSVT